MPAKVTNIAVANLFTTEPFFQNFVVEMHIGAPTAPLLSSVAGGTLAATTLFVKLTYVDAAGESLASSEASLALTVDHVLHVASPAAAGDATGYNVYVGTSTGTETKQNASPIAIGTDWQEPTSGLIAGAALPTTSTARVGVVEPKGNWDSTNSRFLQDAPVYFRNAIIGTTYSFRVAVADKYGNLSAWTAWITDVAGDSTAPTQTYSASAVQTAGGIRVSAGPVSPSSDTDHYDFFWNTTNTAPTSSSLPNLPPSNDATAHIVISGSEDAFVWVRAVDTSGNEQVWASLGGFTSTGSAILSPPTTAPGAPTGLTTVAGQGEFFFSWSAPSGATNLSLLSYTLQTATDSGFTTNVVTYPNLSLTAMQVHKPASTLFWRVNAQYPNSPAGAWANFGAPTSVTSGLIGLDADVVDGDGAGGGTYQRMPIVNMDVNRRGLIDFTQAGHLSKNIDNIADGSNFGRVVNTALTSNQPDLGKSGVLGKIQTNIADDATYSRSSTNGSNIVPDSEMKYAPSYWALTGAAFFANIPNPNGPGGNSIQLPANTVSGTQFYNIVNVAPQPAASGIVLKAGITYTFSAWCNPSTGGTNGATIVYELRTVGGGDYQTLTFVSGSSAQRKSITFTVGASDTTVIVAAYVQFNNSSGGTISTGVVSLSAPMLQVGSAMTAYEGSYLHPGATLDHTPDGSNYVRGAQNAGSAIVLDNANFTAGTAGWSAFDANATISQISSSPFTNGKALQVSTASQFDGAQHNRFFKANPGDQFFMSCWINSDGTFQCKIQISYFDGAGTFLGSDGAFSLSTSWTQISFTGTAPANTASIRVVLIRADAAGGTHICWFTNPHVVRIASLDDEVADGTTFKRVLHVDADNTFHLSTPFVAQGSILPIIVPAGVLSYQTPATGSNQIIAVTWGAFNIALPDGTTVAVPASSALPQTAAPTLSQISGGSLAARTHFVAIALVKAGTIYAFSTENSLAISANFLLKVSSPSAVSGYDGWIPLIGGNVAGSAVLVQQNPTGTTLITPIAFGTDWTEPSTGASTTGIEVFSFAALGTRQAIQVTGLAASTTYHLYLTYNKTMNQVLIPNGARASSDVTAAALAWADGTINLLNNGSASVATGSAGGGTSGTIGGRLV